MSGDTRVRVRRALLSVSDKTGLVDFARGLADLGVEIISTGGTARALTDAGLAVTPAEALTGFPEMLDGRVKTLHPAIHAALLALADDPGHAASLRAHGIEPIDLLGVNLYPFERAVARGAGPAEATEMIDIGGPAMIRSAAKNAQRVAVITSPDDYPLVLDELRRHAGSTTPALRHQLQARAFARTAAYDAAIARWLGADVDLLLHGVRSGELRYGENPHQRGAAYIDPASDAASVLRAEQLHGKALSYNNLLDADAALACVQNLARVAPEQHAAVVIKHTNPCGLAVAPDLASATHLALEGDQLAAFGGIVAVSSTVNARAADRLCQDSAFLEVLLAPGFERDALAMLQARWSNLRILRLPGDGARVAPPVPLLEVRSLSGGWLVQQRDAGWPSSDSWTHVAGPVPTAVQRRTAEVIEVAAARLASNAIAIGASTDNTGETWLVGAGSGTVDRVSACDAAVRKAADRARGAVAVSDAFFPFPDGPEVLLDAGVSMLVHPGGSRRDEETFALCARRGVTCMTTGRRQFRH